MHITITGVHIEITDAMREYVNERLGALKKYVSYGDTTMHLAVELSKTTAHHTHGDVFQVEVHAHRKGKPFTAKAVGNDLYAAVDEVRDILAREFTEHKDKQISLFKRGAHRLKKLLRLQND